MLDIVEKWYKRLGFSTSYDARFYTHLEKTDIKDLSVFSLYNPYDNSPQKNLLACLYFCEELEKKYMAQGIEEQILIDSLQDLVLWNDTYYKMYSDIGISEFPWLDRTFLMQIFRLGRLQFSMFRSEFDIEELCIKVDDNVLEVHIPKGESLNYGECLESFKMAKNFFKKYYPDFPAEWCICHSWLLDESILPLLGEKSNIRKFQTLFKPVMRNASDSVIRFTFNWNTTREKLSECKSSSTFAEKLKQRALAGDEFYEVLGIRRLEDSFDNCEGGIYE